ncbi:MAG: hotdog domain-containing protein, partial [Pseudomonadota bacterium]
AGTTTIESKTNFLRAAPAGTTVQGETVPINAGKRLAVLTTTIRGEDGKDVAVVTQTQLVL